MRGEGGWMLKRGFHPGFQLMRPAALEGQHHNHSSLTSHAGSWFYAWLKQVVVYCGRNKGKVYMEPSETLHPSSLALNSK